MFLEGAAAVETRRPLGNRLRKRRLWLDYETYSDVELVGEKSVGIWNYSRHLSTTALMVTYQFFGEPQQQVDLTLDPFPDDLREALLDPNCEKWGFNAAFERLITKHVLGIKTPTKGWRCSMARANFMSFSGSLKDIGLAMGLDYDKLKGDEGQRLINMFSVPQKPTRNQPHWRRTRLTDPEDWQKFLEYNWQDLVAEREIDDKLERFFIPEWEWDLYENDQDINDVGLPVNRAFVEKAEIISDQRKIELLDELDAITGLVNPKTGKGNSNSNQAFMAWAKERGYPYDDLKKDTVKKVLSNMKDTLSPECVEALTIRRQSSRTSIKKFAAILRRLSPDNRLRHAFQFVGAARTWRWAGRGPQPHNLARTPKVLEAENGNDELLRICADIIENGTLEDVALFVVEPMEALVGSIRSSFQAPEEQELRVCDLSAIESAVLAWLSGCKRLLNVFKEGRDPYRDFATALFKVAYEQVTGAMRTTCKPAVLGCGYQLGGGHLRKGQRTGFWAYAENQGVDLEKEEAHAHVSLFRKVYEEIPVFWKALEDAASAAVQGFPTTVNGLLHFEMDGPFLSVRLPSGSKRYYYRPKVITKEFEGEDEKKYTRIVMSYMGMDQIKHIWGRIATSGGKWAENLTQALARDVLALGIRRAANLGFEIVGHVHDEIITLAKKIDKFFTVDLLRACMIGDIEWATGLPLGAAGYTADIYRKD